MEVKHTERHSILIVGAGPGGLATAAHLRSLGHQPTILEGGPVPGAAWRRRPPRLRLTTPRELNSLPFFPLTSQVGRWLTAKEWSDYLESYATQLDLNVRCSQPVGAIDRQADGWLVHTTTARLFATAVVVATGEDRVPVMPDVPGLGDYSGDLVHSSAIQFLQGGRRDILVIGAGTSGCEVAASLSAQGHRVSLSVRRIPVVLPRHVLGMPTAGFGLFANRMPDWLLDSVGTVVQLAVFGPPHWGNALTPHRLSERRSRRYAPTIDNGIMHALKTGQVRAVPAVARFNANSIDLVGGIRLAPELAIAATGYAPALDQFVRCPDVLDHHGRPLPERVLASRAPGLYFVGLRPRVGPLLREVSVEGRRVAISVSRYIACHSGARSHLYVKDTQ